jgi:hypothetical protein
VGIELHAYVIQGGVLHVREIIEFVTGKQLCLSYIKHFFSVSPKVNIEAQIGETPCGP